jgi:hypothetical protein
MRTAYRASVSKEDWKNYKMINKQKLDGWYTVYVVNREPGRRYP